MNRGPRVAILMGVFDGARFLPAQLDSIAAQRHGNWRLVASDDGSRDASPAILAAFAAAWPGRVQLRRGPGQGFAANYLAMVAAEGGSGDWLAFADQDDVWLPDRLARGVAALAPFAGPALYGSRSLVATADLARQRPSPRCPRPPSFRNALVQNLSGGNTLLANAAAARLLAAAARAGPAVVAHDWWAYQLIAGAGGRVLHDPEPTVIYRQHGGNAIGAGVGWGPRLRRLRRLADGTFRRWSATNLAALAAAADLLTPEARDVLAEFAALRADPLPWRRLRRLRRLGLYRQTRAASAALWLAVLTGRI